MLSIRFFATGTSTLKDSLTMYAPNEIMFPRKAIPAVRNMRGPEWRALVERILQLPETHEETLAFMLMMIRLNGCLECETDSYRAMRGCDLCAIQTLRRYKGPDSELIKQFHHALATVREHLNEPIESVQRQIIPVMEIA
jgi:hypothetical protein